VNWRSRCLLQCFASMDAIVHRHLLRHVATVNSSQRQTARATALPAGAVSHRSDAFVAPIVPLAGLGHEGFAAQRPLVVIQVNICQEI
jgi:hypothetical protein